MRRPLRTITVVRGHRRSDASGGQSQNVPIANHQGSHCVGSWRIASCFQVARGKHLGDASLASRVFMLVVACFACLEAHCEPVAVKEAPSVESVVGRLARWYRSNEVLKFDALARGTFQGGFFGTQEVEIYQKHIACVRRQDRWRIVVGNRGVQVREGRLLPFDTGPLGLEYLATPELRLRIDSVKDQGVRGAVASIGRQNPGLYQIPNVLNEAGWVFGFLLALGDQPVTVVLRSSPTRLLDKDKQAEHEQEHSCSPIEGAHTLETRGRFGNLLIWVDSESGQPHRMIVTKQASDLAGEGDRLLSQVGSLDGKGMYPRGFRQRQTTIVDSVEYRRSESGPLPISFQMEDRIEYDTGSQARVRVAVEYPTLVRPKEIPASDFSPDSQIPESLPIAVVEQPGVLYRWNEGGLAVKYDPQAARKHAEVKFKRGRRSPFYLIGVALLAAAVLVLLIFRSFRDSRG